MLNKDRVIFAFGDFLLEVAEARLMRGGKAIPLAPKAFSMLVLLVERAGELVDKDTILRLLWPDSIVEEANLTVHMSALRKALITEDNTQFIETVPKRGYRFTAQVAVVPPTRDLDAPVPVPLPALEQPRRRRWLGWAAGGALIFAALLVRWGVTRDRNMASPSIAVLPFQSMSQSKDEENYLGLGMADALITRLGMLRDFNVRSTGQVRQFDKPGVDATTAAKELKVDWVLTGTVQHLDKRMRVTVQLIRAATGKTMWAEKYDEFFTNIFAVQDEISERLAHTLAPRLTNGDPPARSRRSTGSAEAFRFYAEGRIEMQHLLPQSDVRARELFEHAVKLDPSYPEPYIGLAEVLVDNWYQQPENRAQYEARARECIDTVRKLEPEWPELYMASGWIAETFNRDWAGAEADYKHALAINPSLAGAHASYGWMLSTLGRLTEAERELRRAFELDPVGDLAGMRLAWVMYEQRRFRDALNLARSVGGENSSQLYSNGIGQLVALCLVHLGLVNEAAREADRIARLAEPQPAILAELYALTGRRQQALAMIAQSKLKIRGVANPLAVAQVALGNKEDALRLLESASDRQEGAILMTKNDIDLEPLWGDARFKALLIRMRLATEPPAIR